MVDGLAVPAAPPGRPVVRMAAIPVLMVAVAAIGTWRHVHDDQTSWRGASVGMFAMVDAPANRLVRGLVRDPEARGGAPDLYVPPEEVEAERTRAMVTPTAENLHRLAEAWAPLIDDGRLVRVEVWATRFRSDGAGPPAVRLELIGSLDAGPGPAA